MERSGIRRKSLIMPKGWQINKENRIKKSKKGWIESALEHDELKFVFMAWGKTFYSLKWTFTFVLYLEKLNFVDLTFFKNIQNHLGIVIANFIA